MRATVIGLGLAVLLLPFALARAADEKSGLDGEGFVRIDDEPRPGDAVIVREGPLKGLTGVFSREMKEDERVMILLNAVSYQARAVIHKSLVKRMF